jgi:predicted Zn finger-like uncharacterized protein
MIEIQCTSCHTRYRIDERVLPDETPTFKCSRCGHVFNAEPMPARPRKPASARAERPRVPEAPSPSPSPGPAEKPQAAPSEPAPAPEAVKQEEQQEDNPLDRTFSRERPEDIEAGENLSFDFASEPPAGEIDADSIPDQQAPADDHWEVGDQPDDAAVRVAPTMGSGPLDEPEPPAADPASQVAQPKPVRRVAKTPEFREPVFAASARGGEEARRSPSARLGIPEDVAEFASRKPAHSAGFFLGMFAGIAALFAVVSLIVHMEPAPVARILGETPRIGANFQRPLVPAMLVALHDVRADYEKIKGGQTALLISGTAENVGSEPLHAVLLAVDLLDESGRQIASNAAFCGNGLTPRMVGEMTPREIEFLQRLDPQKNFAVEPAHSAPFLLVFIDPPRKVANLRIQVAKAVAAQNPAAPRS